MSRDGEHFSYVGNDRRPWLERGPWVGAPPNHNTSVPAGDAWDSSLVAAVRGYVQHEGGIRLFKWGDACRHGSGSHCVFHAARIVANLSLE